MVIVKVLCVCVCYRAVSQLEALIRPCMYPAPATCHRQRSWCTRFICLLATTWPTFLPATRHTSPRATRRTFHLATCPTRTRPTRTSTTFDAEIAMCTPPSRRTLVTWQTTTRAARDLGFIPSLSLAPCQTIWRITLAQAATVEALVGDSRVGGGAAHGAPQRT
ncbi:hypothetical protein Hamer_G018825 [Homarus americanus]|uniref:Uncharacterized protein n=1 Tax=Homarus americanus TaxID=6706 RepID=A0A8J5JR83_HOMAM|nr:hypothetical protein Hamer_G018825 [Homarus americanus]